MDKASFAAKRRQDKHHKKVPPPKPEKQKGKPKAPEVQHTAPLVVCDDRYGKRQIQQNWTEDRDQLSSGSDTEDEQLQAADFEKLLELPPSSGGHFLLSSEKHWLEPDTTLPGENEKDNSELFRIDTKLLNAGLSCIPFHERHGYEKSIFNTLELNLMRQKAEMQANKYKEMLQQDDTKPKPTALEQTEPRKPRPVPCLIGKLGKPKDATVKILQPNTPIEKTAQQSTPVKPVETKMSKLALEPKPAPATISIPACPTVSTKPASAQPNAGKDTKEDIQQWLDDILEI